METTTQKNILIIGAGLSGMSAALYAADHGCHVTLVSSLPSERAQSVMAEGGINAAVNTKGEDDTPEQHYNDTIKAGCFLADQNAVWGMTHAAPGLVRWLHSIGVQFNTADGDLDLRNFGGQKKKRTAFAQSDTGKQLMTALIDAVRRREAEGSIERLNHHLFVTLLLDRPDVGFSRIITSADRCTGCVIKDNYTGRLMNINADAAILCTGGMHGLYGNTTGSLQDTGEVTAELFRLGIPMANLEMVQYHPTTVEIGGKRMLISEAARGEGGRLFVMRNGEKYHFMEEKYPELKNLMPRDITAREIWYMSKEGQVYLDMTEIPRETIEKKLSGLVDDCLTYLNLDLRKEPIPVYPGIHYFMGGIQVDEHHRTILNGLYAAGECCAQYHGANRLGGNSLLGAIYGGRTAATTVYQDIVSHTANAETSLPQHTDYSNENNEKLNSDDNKINDALSFDIGNIMETKHTSAVTDSAIAGTETNSHTAISNGSSAAGGSAACAGAVAAGSAVPMTPSGLSTADKQQLNRIMLSTLGVVRNEAMLKEGEAEILKLQGRFPLLGLAVIESAISRKESRGAHFRDDYPDRDEEHFHKTTVARYDGSKIIISFEPIPERRCE